jgi:hypothetical protein
VALILMLHVAADRFTAPSCCRKENCECEKRKEENKFRKQNKSQG